MNQADYLSRILEKPVERSLQYNPVTVILGPRQCGKSTLAKKMLSSYAHSLYLDLERPSDLQKLDDAEWFLSTQSDRLVCLDEIQRKPEIFPLLRSIVDENRRPGMFLLLGSASRDLLRQSSESLAGRVSYKQLTPFLWGEIAQTQNLETYLARGGFPQSLLADTDEASYGWRRDFITTFLERDLLQFAGFSPATMRRLWQMLAHLNGQTVNYSALGSSLGVSHTTIRGYIDLLEGAFMLKQVPPFAGNTKKRLVKSPRVYLTDTGILSALLNLRNFEHLAGHPVIGSLWESAVLINILGHFPDLDVSFYRTSSGAEVDFVVSDGPNRVAIECKATVSPKLSPGNFTAIEDIHPKEVLVATPIDSGYSMKPGIQAVSLASLPEALGRALRR